MFPLDLDDLRRAFGIGVAGNFAGHLEQAGEAADFADVEADSPEAPKGIFPFYAPGSDSFLGVSRCPTTGSPSRRATDP